LIAEADILIENYRSDSRARLGLSPDLISALNPSIIHAHLGGFEANEARVAYDVVVQAETGFMSMNGEAHGGPNKMPVALMDVLAAHQLKEGILAALYHRALTGEGGYLSCSLEMAGIVSLVNQSANYLNHGKIAQRIGSLHPNIAPYGETFTCADGKEIVLAIGSHAQFKALCILLGEAEWATDERFSNNAARLKNRNALQDLLREKFKSVDSISFLTQCEAANIPAGAIRNIGEVMELEQAKKAVLIDEEEGIELKRIKSVAFTYSPFAGSSTS
ncbi:MAG: CoA transferase, partial [Flavobacteriales bacterium]|nr:CoA transferase [Flavobacteriales bacterium]